MTYLQPYKLNLSILYFLKKKNRISYMFTKKNFFPAYVSVYRIHIYRPPCWSKFPAMVLDICMHICVHECIWCMLFVYLYFVCSFMTNFIFLLKMKECISDASLNPGKCKFASISLCLDIPAIPPFKTLLTTKKEDNHILPHNWKEQNLSILTQGKYTGYIQKLMCTSMPPLQLKDPLQWSLQAEIVTDSN